MKRYILSLICILALTFSATAGRINSYVGKVKDAYNFWLYTPDLSDNIMGIHTDPKPNTNDSIAVRTSVVEHTPVDSIATDSIAVDSTAVNTPKINNTAKTTDSAKPVVIFLHGASLCGKNLSKVKRYGTIDALEGGLKLDAYVIAPQNPGGAWNPHRIMRIVDWLAEHYAVDQNRIYVLGMSLGGYGAIDLAATYPGRIAAALGMCGGASVKNLSGLNSVPLWIVHGTADRAVGVGQSDRVVSEIRRVDPKAPRLIYDRIAGMNHSRPARFFYLEETYAWLFSHSLSDPGRPVNPSFDPKSGILDNAYKGLKLKPKSKSTKKSKKRRRSRRRR